MNEECSGHLDPPHEIYVKKIEECLDIWHLTHDTWHMFKSHVSCPKRHNILHLAVDSWDLNFGTCPCSGKRSFLSLFLLIRQKK